MTMMTPEDRIRHAQACIADSLRHENGLGTRIDAAVQALRYLGKDVDANASLQHYLDHRYDLPHGHAGTYVYVLALAQDLLAKMEAEVANPDTLAALKAAKSGVVTDVSFDDL